MGTYINVQLACTDEQHIKECNQQLNKMGYKPDVFNGVEYGAFVTRESLEEDARFMNTDPEGLKQAPGWERPITVEQLESLIWNHLGRFQMKLSGGSTDEELALALIVAKWANKNKKLLNPDESDNYQPGFVASYMVNPPNRKKIPKHRFTQSAFIQHLNECAPPFDSDQWIMGGKRRTQFAAQGKYGQCMKKHDPIGFQCAFNDWKRR